MKRVFILIILSLTFSPFAQAQNFKGKAQPAISILDPEKGLRIGETLVYSMEWLGVPVGKIVLKTEGLVKINGHECYHISAEAMPNKFFRHFYDIEYKVHTYLDAKYFYTRRFEKVRRINKEFNYLEIDFDQEKNEARYKSWGSNLFIILSNSRQKAVLDKPATTNIPYGTQDLFSSFYYFRLIKIKEGKSYPINIYYDQRNWPTNIKIDKPFWKEIRKRGAFSLVKVYPSSDLNDYILGKRDFAVYITTDSRRIPLEFRLKTSLGPVRGIIQDSPK